MCPGTVSRTFGKILRLRNSTTIKLEVHQGSISRLRPLQTGSESRVSYFVKMVEAGPLRPVRPVGSLAKWNTSRHHLGLCRSVAITCRYETPKSIARNSINHVLENALAKVICQHDMLRVGIANEGAAEPAFVDLETIDLRQAIEWKELASKDSENFGDDSGYTSQLLRSLEEQHNKLWDNLESRPPWKLIVHEKGRHVSSEKVKLDVTFSFHHAISDGQSAMILHRDFLRALNGSSVPNPDLTDHLLRLKPARHLPPPMEAIVPFKISWIFLLQTIFSQIIWKKFRPLLPQWLRSEPSPREIPWTGEPVSLEPYQSNLRFFHVPEENLNRLIAACRTKGTTLTPLFHALILKSLITRLPSRPFLTDTPISLRPFTSPEFDREKIHCLATGHEFLFGIQAVEQYQSTLEEHSKQSTFSPHTWEMAIELGKSLKNKVARLPNDDPIALLPWVSDWTEFWMSKVGKKRGSSWECSNAGSLKASDSKGPDGEAGWQIKRSLFSQGALPMGSAFTVSLAGVQGHGLSVTVSWQEGIVEAELIDGLVRDLQEDMARMEDVEN